jgi:hypothetical protein
MVVTVSNDYLMFTNVEIVPFPVRDRYHLL